MEYKIFKEAVTEKIKEIMGEEAFVTVHRIAKNNGLYVDGLSIRMKGENMAPAVYLNDYYDRYADEDKIEDTAYEIITIYEENRIKGKAGEGFFSAFENIRPLIAYKLIHYGKNKELLKELPHIRVLDLALVCYCLVNDKLLGCGTIQIRNSHLDMWKVSTEEVFLAAEKNTPGLLPVEITTIEQTIEYELNKDASFGLRTREGGIPMYVATNQIKQNGAACILYKDVLKDFAEAAGSDLHILPCSIHEMILVPAAAGIEASRLLSLVQEVNRYHLEQEEILSDNVYTYRRENDKITSMF